MITPVEITFDIKLPIITCESVDSNYADDGCSNSMVLDCYNRPNILIQYDRLLTNFMTFRSYNEQFENRFIKPLFYDLKL